tara:strand:+ start:503 stop:775 length:273 start_codon:yes stop_codon:yes gene_type:complete
MFKAVVQGKVYSPDNIFSARGYAKAVFPNTPVDAYAKGKVLYFTVRDYVYTDSTDVNASLVEAIPTTYTGNIEWEVAYYPGAPNEEQWED